MASFEQQDVTGLLQAWASGDKSSLDKLIPIVYAELHRPAHQYMRGEQRGHILQTTALINEVYVRLIDSDHQNLRNRAHFLAVSAQLMRQILVDFRPKIGCCDLCHLQNLLALIHSDFQ